MKKYQEENFNDIEVAELSIDELQHIRARLSKHYSFIGGFPHGSIIKDKLLQNIRNFNKLQTFPIRTCDQCMALIIENLPQISSQVVFGKNTILLSLIKQVLILEDYKNASFRERKIIVSEYRNALDVNKDWRDSVRDYYYAALNENLAHAYGFLQEIQLLEPSMPKDSSNPGSMHKYKCYLICSEIVLYIDILTALSKLQDHQGSLTEFSSKVFANLYNAIERFNSLNHKQPEMTLAAMLRGMFFSCLGSCHEVDDRSAAIVRNVVKRNG